jgi:hypothetical protein
MVGAFRRRPDLLWRRSLDAVVLLPVDAEEPMTIAGTGVDVWELLDSWRTIDGIAELLADRYDAEPERVAGDVSALVRQLREGGALEEGGQEIGPTSG